MATVELADQLTSVAQEADPAVGMNYNRHYIGLAKDGVAKNFMAMRPRRASLIAEFRLPPDDDRYNEYENLGFDVLPYDKRFGRFRLRLKSNDFEERSEHLRALAHQAEEFYRNPAGER